MIKLLFVLLAAAAAAFAQVPRTCAGCGTFPRVEAVKKYTSQAGNLSSVTLGTSGGGVYTVTLAAATTVVSGATCTATLTYGYTNQSNAISTGLSNPSLNLNATGVNGLTSVWGNVGSTGVQRIAFMPDAGTNITFDWTATGSCTGNERYNLTVVLTKWAD